MRALRLAVPSLMVAVLGLGTVAPAGAAVQLNSRVRVTDEFYNQCFGERVRFERFYHVQGRVREREDGYLAPTGLHVNVHIDGVGLESGDRYVTTSVTNQVTLRDDDGAVVFTVVTTGRTVRRGDDGAEFAHASRWVGHFTIDANGRVTANPLNYDSGTFSCG